VVTLSVLLFIYRVRPELIGSAGANTVRRSISPGRLVLVMVIATVLTGGIISWFASGSPDGLEWSIFKASGSEEVEGLHGGAHAFLKRLQDRISFLPDYSFPRESASEESGSWPSPDAGTSVSGLVGGVFTLMLVAGIGYILHRRARKKPS
jgi:cobalt/nickel transport system permease protein